jgi:hypothetical protein
MNSKLLRIKKAGSTPAFFLYEANLLVHHLLGLDTQGGMRYRA